MVGRCQPCFATQDDDKGQRCVVVDPNSPRGVENETKEKGLPGPGAIEETGEGIHPPTLVETHEHGDERIGHGHAHQQAIKSIT